MISVDGGHNNWWHLDVDIKEEDTQLLWNVNHGRAQSMSLEHAAKYTAELIANRYDNLHLAMSGGLDSEFVANVLYENHIPFTPVILGVPKSNNYDYFYALYWCQQRNLKPIVLIYDFDHIDLQKAYAYICKNYRITSNTYIFKVLYDEVTKRGGHILTGEGNLTCEYLYSTWDEPVGNQVQIWPETFFPSLFCRGAHPGELLSYTPEMVLALLKNLDTTVNNALAKTKLYNIPFRPKTWPIIALSQTTKQKIQKLTKVEMMQQHAQQCWSRTELMSVLENKQ